LLLARLESRVWDLPETEVLPHLRRMTELGDEGVAAVARMLASDDETVAEAAQVVLSEQLDHWRTLPIEKSAPHALRLAQVLAKCEPPSSPAGRNAITDFGMQLVLWPAADRTQAEELVAHCERIFTSSR
jgi:hypothetical protein